MVDRDGARLSSAEPLVVELREPVAFVETVDVDFALTLRMISSDTVCCAL